MKTLTKFAPLAIVAASVSVAGAAQAQPARAWQTSPARTAEIRKDIHALDNQIDRVASRRTISAREAAGLHRQVVDVKRVYSQYARGGLDRGEVRDLQNRVNSIRVALRMERRDWDGRRG